MTENLRREKVVYSTGPEKQLYFKENKFRCRNYLSIFKIFLNKYIYILGIFSKISKIEFFSVLLIHRKEEIITLSQNTTFFLLNVQQLKSELSAFIALY